MASTQTRGKEVKTTNKAIVAKGAANIATKIADMSTFDAPIITQRERIIPRIVPMQGLSKAVAAGDAKFGEFRDSATGELLGDINNPVTVLPLVCFKQYLVKKLEKGGTFKFVKIIPNVEELPYEQKTKEGEFKNEAMLTFLVLLQKQLKERDPVPYAVSFKSSSFGGGKKLIDQMYIRNAPRGEEVKPEDAWKFCPLSMVMDITGAKKTNDKGTFIVMDVKQKRAATEKEVYLAYNTLQLYRDKSVKVDNAVFNEEAEAPEREVSEDEDEF
jgi:hypothetical protein